MPDDGNGITPQTPPETPPALPAGQVVPYERFRDVVGERDRFKAEVSTLQEQLAQAQQRGATVDTLAAQVREAKAHQEAAERRYEHFSTVAAAGITQPELVAEIERHYNGLPQKDRPKLGDMLAAWKGTPEAPGIEQAPLLLRPHLEKIWAPAAAPPTPPKPAGGHGGGGPHQPPAGRPLDPQAIFELAQRAQRGEISIEEYRKLASGR